MIHVTLGLLLISSAIGTSFTILLFLLYHRHRYRLFLAWSFPVLGTTILSFGYSIRIYMLLAVVNDPDVITGAAVLLIVIGECFNIVAFPIVAHTVVGLPVPVVIRYMMAGCALLYFPIALSGRLGITGPRWPINDIGAIPLIFVSQIYALVIIVRNRRRIENHLLKSLVRVHMAVMVFFLVLSTIHYLIGVSLHAYPFTPLIPVSIYFIVICIVGISFASRYYFSSSREHGIPTELIHRYGLSKREQELIPLLIDGCSGRDIAIRLCISLKTVKNHVYHIYRKTGAGDRIELFNLLRPFDRE